MLLFLFFFFFQAEDGIRDRDVTGVQTCALPILSLPVPPASSGTSASTGTRRRRNPCAGRAAASRGRSVGSVAHGCAPSADGGSGARKHKGLQPPAAERPVLLSRR